MFAVSVEFFVLKWLARPRVRALSEDFIAGQSITMWRRTRDQEVVGSTSGVGSEQAVHIFVLCTQAA